MTRDIAAKFNQTYGETFVVPEPVIRRDCGNIPGLDGQKMSKSYGNTLEIFADEKALRKKIMSIVMDSRTPAEPKPDAERNICVQFLKLLAPSDVAADYEARLRAGGLGYGDLKKGLFEHFWAFFAPARARRAELLANPDYVDQVLRDGAARARSVAAGVIRRARKAAGLE
jgi:tryptophanyl-tRNA synthetase